GQELPAAAAPALRWACARSTRTRQRCVVKLVPCDAYGWLYILAAAGPEYLTRECRPGRRPVALTAAEPAGSGGRVRLIAAALKAAGRASVPGVQIPPAPQQNPRSGRG